MPTETPPRPYDWLRSLTPSLAALGRIPIAAHPAEFSLEELAATLQKQLEIAQLEIALTTSQWMAADSVKTGLPSTLKPLYFSVGTLPGYACWLMGEADVTALMRALLGLETTLADTREGQLQEGFYHFLAVEVIHGFDQLGFNESIAPRLSKQDLGLAETEHYCFDVSLSLNGQTVKGRLALSPDLVQAWKTHFAARAQEISHPHSSLMQIPITVQLEAGKVSLLPKEWKQIKEGDFLFLDSCSVVPGSEKNRILLTVEGIPVFRGMLKTDKVKILEYPLYHEANTPMSYPPDENSEHDLDDLSENDETEEVEEREEENFEVPALTNPEDEAAPAPSSPAPATIHDIPLNIVVEVGRVQMTFAKLAELQPGSVLELNVNPADGVSLVVNGRCIGKGELLKIGESLGVRILEK